MQAKAIFLSEVPSDAREDTLGRLSVCSGDTEWRFDNENEFYAEFRQETTASALFEVVTFKALGGISLSMHYYSGGTKIDIMLPSRSQIERVFEVFEAVKQDCFVSVERPRTRIFIGHGRCTAWRDLKDHLHEKHGFEVEAYETGARAGYSIAEFLERSQANADFALLLHSAEDEDSSGRLHARENVIHETGLFQGRLGFRRAIVLREEGCAEFSNLAGVQEIRFSKGNIRETFGEVLATLKRELNDEDELR